MFTNISWQDYIMAVAATVTIYYIAVGLRYYRPELKELLSSRRGLSFGSLRKEELTSDELDLQTLYHR